MIDTLSLLLSVAACLLIVVRAVILDRSEPWFGPDRAREAAGEAEEQAPVQPPASGWRNKAGRAAPRRVPRG